MGDIPFNLFQHPLQQEKKIKVIIMLGAIVKN
jgi:hypothetical protein